uniref:Follicle cell protein 3C-1 n=1 Tax=Glossina austeni TaxID=7395 RepID=A0A1A9VB23_GLOAU
MMLAWITGTCVVTLKVIDSRPNEKSTLTIMDNHNLTASVSPVDAYANNTNDGMRSNKSQQRTPMTTNLPLISKNANVDADHVSSSTPLITKLPSDYDQVPCTCGIFLGSQVKSQNITNNSALIISELNRFYDCDKRGQMRCQTNCLEQIMQFLPKSDRIICASSSDDVLNEKAYLLIKNCRNYWINTNLTSGHEYCCKAGRPYKCTNK